MTIAPGGNSGPEDKHTGNQIIYGIAEAATIEVEYEGHFVPFGSASIIQTNGQYHEYNRNRKEIFFLSIYAPPLYLADGNSHRHSAQRDLLCLAISGCR